MQRSRRFWCKQALQQLQPQAVRQAHVGDDGVELLAVQLLPGLSQRAGGIDAVTLAQQCELVQRAQVRLVVDDQDAGGRDGSGTSGYCVKAAVPGQRGRGGSDEELVALTRRGRRGGAARGSRSVRRAARTARGRCRGPGRWSGSPRRRRARTGGAAPPAPAARRRSRPCRRGWLPSQRVATWIESGAGARIAQRVVQQVDQHAPQVVGSNATRAPARPETTARALLRVCRANPRPAATAASSERRSTSRPCCCTRATFEDLVDDLRQPLRVLPHQRAELPVPGSLQVFLKQGVGLGDGRQRVADFVGDRGRHPAHGGQFSVRSRASISRRSSRNITHRQSCRSSCGAVSRVRTERVQRWPDARTAVRLLRFALREGARPARPAASMPAADSSKGAARRAACPPAARAAGLAACTSPSGSTTSTPSLSVSITSSFTCAWIRAARWLRAPAVSSRASRAASWLARRATTKYPVPVSPPAQAPASTRLQQSAEPGVGQQQQGDRGGRAQREQGSRAPRPSAPAAKQRGVVDAAGLQRTAVWRTPAGRCRWWRPLRIEGWPGTGRVQQPHRQRRRQVGGAQADQPAAQRLAECRHQALQQQQHQRHKDAGA